MWVSLTFFVHIWFPLDILNSHVAASCCVMEWKDCNNKAHDPKPSFLFSAIVHTFFLRSNDIFSLLPVAFWTPFFGGLLMNICMCLPGRAVCAVCAWWKGVRLSVWEVFTGCGRSRPPELLAPDRALQGPSCPRAESYRQQNKSNANPPPHPCQLENDRPGHSAQRPFTINSN